MGTKSDRRQERKKAVIFLVVFLAVNVVAAFWTGSREISEIERSLTAHAQDTKEQLGEVLQSYRKSFRLFSRMMARELENNPDPDDIWKYLKTIDAPLLEIEGETFDGLYMYYQGRYLYSWDTPYSVYEDTGYVATERPWYKAAVEGQGEIVFTPPYMSYANHYILTTISQLQPDGETVFAYDIKMGDIQKLVSTINQFENEEIMIFDGNGTVIGSTNSAYLGGDLQASLEDTAETVEAARSELEALDGQGEEASKAQDKLDSAAAFYSFRQKFDQEFSKISEGQGKAVPVSVDKTGYYGLLLQEGEYSFLIFVPVTSLLKSTLGSWLVPMLIVEILLIYILGRVSKELKNRELKAAYVELGQIEKRLEIALSAAQKAAAIDDLTGMMNVKSFRREVVRILDSMEEEERGILIMIDGDHFKQVNDGYGHTVGDEVIKLTAQMIIGRIRTVDLASRLHGDEFAIFISNASDYAVAAKIMDDINKSIAKEAGKRNFPAITLSAGAVVAKRGDTYTALSKTADEALYRAKETHNGGFAAEERAL